MSKLILTMTSGRSGSLFLTEVFKQHSLGDVTILHEEGGRPPWRAVLPEIAEAKTGLILTGRNVASALAEELMHYEPHGLILVRDCMEVCRSWYERIPQSIYNYEHVAGYWPYRNLFCPLDRSWSEFQTYIWHWVSTYHAAREYLQPATSFVLPFDKLNDVEVMNGMLGWTGMMKKCSAASLDRCMAAKNPKNVYRSCNVNAEKELREWVNTLDTEALFKMDSTLKWLSSYGKFL